jgi:hypothetical protein|tara:strand:- start:214 stop:447 length:234 start_codon:yes stop_codon:yes gene_type:complete
MDKYEITNNYLNPIMEDENGFIIRLPTEDGSGVFINVQPLHDSFAGRYIILNSIANELLQALLIRSYEQDIADIRRT